MRLRLPALGARPSSALVAAALMFSTPAEFARAEVAAPLQIREIFAREPLIGRAPASITWAPDGSRFLYTLPGGEAGPLDTHLYDVRRQHDRIFFRAAAEGKGARPAPEFVWSPDSRRLAYLDAGDLWVVAADGSGRMRLAAAADDPQWSPDSTRVAYVHDGDVYAVRPGGGRSTRYSFDGSATTLNGDPDWVYSEELDMHHAYRWSPDGTQIAYLRFDQRPIVPFPIVDFLDPVNTVETQRYPLAGGRNSIVSLRVASAGGATRTLYSTKRNDDYLASVGWMPGGFVVANILDRAQKQLRYVAFTGSRIVSLAAERDTRWIDFRGAPTWLRDKQHYLFISDRDGASALYRGDVRSHQAVQLTRGLTVTALAGIDEQRHVAYVDAAFPSRRDSTVLMVPLAGGRAQPLARGHGTHVFSFAPNGRDFVRSDSAFGVPPAFAVGSTRSRSESAFVRTSLAGRRFGRCALMQIDSQFGKLDAWMIKPPDFDPAKRYPVITYVYGGPAAPTTTDSWDGATYLFHQALAQRGFIVFSVDGPGSQIDSARAVRRLYHRLGPASLAGQLAGITYLRGQSYVDSTRIGLWGWSFGGYETAYALTHAPRLWKVGVAVAPVTDWRYYDTIYTERYMGTPQQNPAAYRESSVVARAAALGGRLLLLHGTADDNVHLANSVALVQAFVRSGKQVDFMVYPRKAHGISGIPQQRHLFNHMLEYWQAHL